MNTKFILPVIDTENLKFEYHGRDLTREEFGNMEYEHFLRTNKQVQMFVNNIAQGISNYDNGITGRFKNVSDDKHPDIVYNFEESEGIVLNAKKREVDEAFFQNYIDNGKMFILILNFNPNTLSDDAKSELLFWIKDSTMVVNDRTLPDDVKLKSLQDRYMWITVNGRAILLNKCKMIQNYSDKSNPFKIGIIVEKATYDGKR